YEVTRIRENELGEETSRPSYQRGTPRKLATIALTKANLNVPPAAAVTNVRPAQPAPVRAPREEVETAPAPQPAPFRTPAKSVGLWDRTLGSFGAGDPTLPGSRETQKKQGRGGRNERSDRGSERGERKERGDRNQRRERGGRNRNERRDEQRRGGQAQKQEKEHTSELQSR